MLALQERLARGHAADACRLAVATYQGLRPTPSPDDSVRLYWCEGFGRPIGKSVGLRRRGKSVFAQNFGDALSPLVVSLVSGRRVTYTVGPGKLVAIGSVFFGLRDRDTVWGAGIRRREDVAHALHAKNARYAAVRGPRTWQALRHAGIDCPRVFGDPASVLPLYVANDVVVTCDIGVVPHWTEFAAARRELTGSGARVIDVIGDVSAVARQILSCRLIFSSSLHGLIFAEAYGIPALFVTCGRVHEDDFTKVADYFESTDRDPIVRRLTQWTDVSSLTSELTRVPTPRFQPHALLRAFPPGARTAPAAPFGVWSSGVRALGA